MKTAFRFIFFLSAVIILFSCKKYPENNLWFKNPVKVIARDYQSPWILEYYSVNDIDSTNSTFLLAYKEEGLYVLKGSNSSNGFKCPGVFDGGSFRYSDRKRYVNFQFSLDAFHSNSTINSSHTSQRNIFLAPGFNWKIEKLCKAQFWISTTYNNIKYEIHFK